MLAAQAAQLSAIFLKGETMTVPKIWRHIPQYYNLIGKKCLNCGALYFPPRDVCPSCGKYMLKEYKFKGTGKILTYTVIRTPFADSESEVKEIPSYESPYVLAIIELDEGPKLTAQITDCEPKNIKIGSDVRAVFRKIEEHGKQGVIKYGYKFKLV